MASNINIENIITTLRQNGITDDGEGFYLDDASKYITRSGLEIKPKRNVVCTYYLVGGGATGNNGSGTDSNRKVGNGGGGGGVQIGRVKLISGTTYKVKVGDGGVWNLTDKSPTAGKLSSISGGSTTIEVEGGNKTGYNAKNIAPVGDNVIPIANHTSTASINGNGGISDLIGGTAGTAGHASNLDGLDGSSSMTIGGGGGGGFGNTGKGGNGGNGVVILIVEQAEVNDIRIQEIEKQLREMNQLPGTMADQYNQQYNATMMAGAVWTVLATSLVYYVFTQV
jgi:hypothetical protein